MTEPTESEIALALEDADRFRRDNADGPDTGYSLLVLANAYRFERAKEEKTMSIHEMNKLTAYVDIQEEQIKALKSENEKLKKELEAKEKEKSHERMD